MKSSVTPVIIAAEVRPKRGVKERLSAAFASAPQRYTASKIFSRRRSISDHISGEVR